eukprot:GHVU01161069.1.p2 GENE.GHVU01161069.1~~GHVU01161069.1.p2  ORF type:complete len:224 (-),score=43.58 GHVU01161069.1:23-694(-)
MYQQQQAHAFEGAPQVQYPETQFEASPQPNVQGYAMQPGMAQPQMQAVQEAPPPFPGDANVYQQPMQSMPQMQAPTVQQPEDNSQQYQQAGYMQYQGQQMMQQPDANIYGGMPQMQGYEQVQGLDQSQSYGGQQQSGVAGGQMYTMDASNPGNPVTMDAGPGGDGPYGQVVMYPPVVYPIVPGPDAVQPAAPPATVHAPPPDRISQRYTQPNTYQKRRRRGCC